MTRSVQLQRATVAQRTPGSPWRVVESYGEAAMQATVAIIAASKNEAEN